VAEYAPAGPVPEATDVALLKLVLATTLEIEPAAIRSATVADRIWEREWLRDFKAMRFGRVCGSAPITIKSVSRVPESYRWTRAWRLARAPPIDGAVSGMARPRAARRHPGARFWLRFGDSGTGRGTTGRGSRRGL